MVSIQGFIKSIFFLVLVIISLIFLFPDSLSLKKISVSNTVIKLEDVSDSSGVIFTHKGNLDYVLKILPDLAHLKPWYEAVSASVSVVDINKDGFYDIFFTSSTLDSSSKFFINNKDGTFTDKADEYGLGKLGYTSRVAFFDCDNDKKMEMVVVGHQESKIYKSDAQNRFSFLKSLFVSRRSHNTSAVNIFDYDGDGNLDILINSLIGLKLPNNLVSATNGEELFFYKGLGNCSFENAKEVFNNKKKLFVHTVGVGDFWNKNKTDLWFATDFNEDHVYRKDEKGLYQDVSNLREASQSQTGMSAEVFYEPDSQLPYIFVSHFYEPGYFTQGNMVWRWSEEKKRFINHARKMNLNTCGWAWGAASVDLENDGDLDMVVGNGFITGKSKRNWWFIMKTTFNSSSEIVSNPRNWPSMKDANFAGNQQGCVFVNNGKGNYENISEQIGFDSDKRDNRGVARIDFNNDGLIDFAVANQKQKAYLYKNKSFSENNWIGFKLEATRTQWQALSAKLILTLEDGTKLYKGNHNQNGYASQHDPRVVFGLGDKKPSKLEILWPSGHQSFYDNLKLKEYHLISEE